MNGHTPGPWQTDKGPSGLDMEDCECAGLRWGGIRAKDGDGLIVAEVLCDVDELAECAEANARLIAASPSLLLELTRLVAYYEPSETRPEAKAKLLDARAAIAKAEVPA